MVLIGQHVQRILPGANANSVNTEMTSLKELYLKNNNLTDITNSVSNSSHLLEVLDLGSNKIHHIEKSVFMGMPNFNGLYLNKNNIAVLQSGIFEMLFNLTTLVSENPIKTFPFQDLFKIKLANLTMIILIYLIANLQKLIFLIFLCLCKKS